MSKFSDALRKRRFVITGEIDPPKEPIVEEIISQIESLKNIVVAANVTDNPVGIPFVSTISVCKIMIEKGLEPIYQITCRDRNRIAIQSDILGSYMLGIRNILALTGDYPLVYKEAKPVFDLDSVQLIYLLNRMRKDKIDFFGRKLSVDLDIFIGGALNPNSEPLELEIMKLEKKIKAGVDFIQTQVVFDRNVLEKLKEKTSHLDVPILIGVTPLKSVKMAEYFLQNVPGIKIPKELIDRLKSSKNKIETAIQIASEIIKEAYELKFAGIHIMPVGMHDYVKEMISKAGI